MLLQKARQHGMEIYMVPGLGLHQRSKPSTASIGS
jgi:hypothetical protein